MVELIVSVTFVTLLFFFYKLREHNVVKQKEENYDLRYICPKYLPKLEIKKHISKNYPNKHYSIFIKDGLRGIIDKNGKVLIPPNYDDIRSEYDIKTIWMQNSFIKRMMKGQKLEEIEERNYYLLAIKNDHETKIDLPITP